MALRPVVKRTDALTTSKTTAELQELREFQKKM
jgi:hypothetical protein